jgi:hypothetical protein
MWPFQCLKICIKSAWMDHNIPDLEGIFLPRVPTIFLGRFLCGRGVLTSMPAICCVVTIRSSCCDSLVFTVLYAGTQAVGGSWTKKRRMANFDARKRRYKNPLWVVNEIFTLCDDVSISRTFFPVWWNVRIDEIIKKRSGCWMAATKCRMPSSSHLWISRKEQFDIGSIPQLMSKFNPSWISVGGGMWIYVVVLIHSWFSSINPIFFAFQVLICLVVQRWVPPVHAERAASSSLRPIDPEENDATYPHGVLLHATQSESGPVTDG